MIALAVKALIIDFVGGGVPMVTLADNDINNCFGVAASIIMIASAGCGSDSMVTSADNDTKDSSGVRGRQ